jgi:hypothetical protein
MSTQPFTKTIPPDWLLAFWKEIDDKTFGKGFDCFAKDAICNLGVADWHGRDAIRENLRAFIDTGFTAHHDVVEYWDGGALKVFRGVVTMTPDDKSKPVVRPTMTHFRSAGSSGASEVGLYCENRSAFRARAFAASSSRFLDGALVLSEYRRRAEAAAISSTAA